MLPEAMGNVAKEAGVKMSAELLHPRLRHGSTFTTIEMAEHLGIKINWRSRQMR